MPKLNQGHKPKDYNAAMRQKRVLELRLQGWEFEDIAHEVGYSNKSGAYHAYKAALANLPKPAAQEELQSSLMRLNAAIKHLWAKIERGDTFAIDQLNKLEDRRAKLLGLDAKGEAQITNQIVIREYGVDVKEV